MAQPPVRVYYTCPFSQPAKEHLESLLSNVSEWTSFSSVPYNPAHNGLSPSQLFQHLGNTFSETSYALIADQRTATELEGSAPTDPTLTVAAAWQITPGDEWDLYRGPQDLDSMPEDQRIALLRGLAEQRANQEAQESGGEEWFWEPNSEQRGIDAVLWQVKSVRADLAGAVYICSVYAVKDIRDMHLYFKRTADTSGGVFHPPAA
ncbi:hypothetical protein LshimejAT787_0703880 [Lyophyllum shimeji]|uniref:Uncharacterized protein n=1 Tax=Lyophyllum shimeji TaxID=47721 RepID=A0A9P3UNP2_LYOSH|nr:hypothetical protein LshimejAT787_0703880 [Lyophyllum shimeji]